MDDESFFPSTGGTFSTPPSTPPRPLTQAEAEALLYPQTVTVSGAPDLPKPRLGQLSAGWIYTGKRYVRHNVLTGAYVKAKILWRMRPW